MTADLAFVAGFIVACLSVLSFLKGYVEGHLSRVAFVMLAAGLGLIFYAELHHPAGYTVAGIPMAFVRVVGDFMR
ncbi:MAG: hypothetical protein KGI94_00215 [Paracoccaceae bacterium]|nr:hypothetical protein [Paracoccaceae bacterium]